MLKSDKPAFDEVKKQLATGKVSFDQAVTSYLGVDEETINAFIRDTSIYDLQDHFRAAGDEGKVMLDLSKDVVALRRGKLMANSFAPSDFIRPALQHVLESYPDAAKLEEFPRFEAFSGFVLIDLKSEKVSSPLADKFFGTLKALKEQGAPASEKLVESWIRDDLVKAQHTMKERNGIRSRLMMHQFDL